MNPRSEVMDNLVGGSNIALYTCRQTTVANWAHTFVCKSISDDCYISNRTSERGYAYPLYLFPSPEGLAFTQEKEPNFTVSFLKELATTLDLPQKGAHGLPDGVTPEDIFHYAYGVFHSPGYRSRYAEFLKIDFPRLPLTGKLELFRALARLGGELTALHLLESPKLDQPITEYLGGRSPAVEKISWSQNTVWLDKAQTTGFHGVREDVWNFHIGGYQVCEKWLKDRKGRTLSADDRIHYQKIIVALSETIRLMKEIDAVIEKHGGWPLK
jgi:predicted helicase